VALVAGLTCPGTEGGGTLNPPVAEGNHVPRVFITGIDTPDGNNFAEVGELVTISFTGEDGEDTASVRIFASLSSNPTPAQEIPILNDFPVGPGVGSGTASWNTTVVPGGAYNIFAEIDDGTNPPVRVVSASTVQLAPPGSSPLDNPPQIVMIDPLPNLGLSSQDDVTVRYIYADIDSPVTVTLLLDKDLNPTNDDINNPGDPFDPNSNIIILPSTVLSPTDPAGDADLRRNPRNFPNPTVPGIFPFPGAPLDGVFKEYRFQINFSQIPVRSEPYRLRATISDGIVTRHAYAVGSITISALASGVVDAADLGFSLAGARFQGFSDQENLGTDFVSVTDLDFDGVDDFMIASRFGSPRNRFQCGAAYLLFGRRKTPFPPDTNGNGIPDVIDEQGNVVDFPAPPDYLPNPYDSRNVGRFGGVVSINSVSSFFRGTVYGMPQATLGPLGIFSNGYPSPSFPFVNGQPPPSELNDPDHPNAYTGGLTSIARFDLNDDGVPDLVFGLPFIAGAYDNHDDDPADGCDETYGFIFDANPNYWHCEGPPSNDDIGPVNQGQVIMVDGTSDLRNIFRRFVDAGIAGQFDPLGAVDDEGIIHFEADTPNGVRIRGGWFDDQQFGVGIDQFNEMGRTVASMPSVDNDLGDDLLVSSPGFSTGFGAGPGRGRIDVWRSQDYTSDIHYSGEPVLSLPGYGQCPGGTCVDVFVSEDETVSTCIRCFFPTPIHTVFFGQQDNDHLGYAGPAGQFNQDGTEDAVAGAPGASRQAINPISGLPSGPVLNENGIFYVFFMPAGGPGNTDLSVEPFPHLEIRGSHANDQFGRVQTEVQDINGDGISDVAFASELYDDPVAGVDAGNVGVIFGDRQLTGEYGFAPEQVGTPVLPGVRFRAKGAGQHMGRDITSAGDFNGDGFGDLLITVPDEHRTVNGEDRVGVTYLIFGGVHLRPEVNGRPNDNVFNLSEVGQLQLPGVQVIARLVPGSGDERLAKLETVGGIGDIDGDGFDDIMIGAPRADFVDPLFPNQRRLNTGEVYLIYGNNFGSNMIP